MTEAQIQVAVIKHLRERGAPGVFFFHPANGGWRSPIEAKILKGLGVVAGVPDLIIIHQGRTYGLELKTETGKLTADQHVVQCLMEEAGAFCCTAHSLDRALRVLEDWGLLRGRAQ